MKVEQIFNIIDDLLQDCANYTIYREDIEEDTINYEELELIYNNVKLFTIKLKDKIEEEL